MNRIDSAGLKFKILRENGEDVDISFVKFNKGKPTKLYIRGHEYSDGLGFFADLFEFHYKEKIGDLPIAKTDSKPGNLKRFFFFILHIIRQRPRDYQWKTKSERIIELSTGFNSYTFDSTTSSKLYEYCKREKTSLNALIINLFDKVAKEHLLKSDLRNSKRVWMVPVSLRSKKQQNLRYGNFVTTLSVYTDNLSTPLKIFEQMKKMLKSGLPWGGLWVANISKVLGENRMRKMSSKEVNAPYVGLVTNLGKWSFNLKECESDRWTLVAPVSRFAPISVSLFNWNHELSISMQLHPLLKRTPAESRVLFKNVLELISKLLSEDLIVTSDTFIKWKDLEDCKKII